MNTLVESKEATAHDWTSVRVANTAFGYSINERSERFAAEHMTEVVCRTAALVFVIAAYAQLLLPALPMTKAVILLAFSATGLVLYAFATRGFKKAVKVDLAARELRASKQNSSGKARITVAVGFSDIESIYVRRPDERGGLASLELRKRGIPPTVCLLRGRESEVAALHQRLCRDLRMEAEPGKARKAAKARLFAQRAAA